MSFARLSQNILSRLLVIDLQAGKFRTTWTMKFPGIQDRVLSKCSDAHIYLYQWTCSPFQRWQSAFVSSGI